MGNDFAAGFALQEGGFYCMLEIGKMRIDSDKIDLRKRIYKN